MYMSRYISIAISYQKQHSLFRLCWLLLPVDPPENNVRYCKGLIFKSFTLESVGGINVENSFLISIWSYTFSSVVYKRICSWIDCVPINFSISNVHLFTF